MEKAPVEQLMDSSKLIESWRLSETRLRRRLLLKFGAWSATAEATLLRRAMGSTEGQEASRFLSRETPSGPLDQHGKAESVARVAAVERLLNYLLELGSKMFRVTRAIALRTARISASQRRALRVGADS